MLWVLAILSLILLLLCWLLFSRLEVRLDTRIPAITVEWKSIGKATLVYEAEEWWLKIGLPFFSKNWLFQNLVEAKSKGKTSVKTTTGKKNKPLKKWLPKLFKMLTTFEIKEWQIAIDTGDYSQNAWLYALNFLPVTQQHVQVNFIEENFLVLHIRNTPWRILYTLIK